MILINYVKVHSLFACCFNHHHQPIVSIGRGKVRDLSEISREGGGWRLGLGFSE